MVVELPALQKYLNYLTESRRRRKFLPCANTARRLLAAA